MANNTRWLSVVVFFFLPLLSSCATHRFLVGESHSRTVEIRLGTHGGHSKAPYELLDIVSVGLGEYVVVHRGIRAKLDVTPTGITSRAEPSRYACVDGDLMRIDTPSPLIVIGTGGERDVVTISPSASRRIEPCPTAGSQAAKGSPFTSTPGMAGSGFTSLSMILVANLTLTSTPIGADVFVDGNLVGSTSIKYVQPYVGSQVLGIEWRKEGFVTCLRKVKPTFILDVDCALKPIK